MPQIKQNANIIAHTENEIKILDYLFRHSDEDISINSLASILNISPPGSMKILKKLKENGILSSQRRGLADFYRVNLQEESVVNLIKYILEFNIAKSQLVPYVEELKMLKEKVKMCLLFGSIVRDTKEAKDIDVILVLEKSDYNSVRDSLRKIENHLGKKVHAIMQTEEDIKENIKKKDKILIDAIKTGLYLWGSDYVIRGLRQWDSLTKS